MMMGTPPFLAPSLPEPLPDAGAAAGAGLPDLEPELGGGGTAEEEPLLRTGTYPAAAAGGGGGGGAAAARLPEVPYMSMPTLPPPEGTCAARSQVYGM